MEIKIDEPFKGSKSQHIFFGKESRIPSHTDVKFISKNRLVIANRFASKLYLVDIRNHKFSIIDTLLIKYNGKLDYPDLIDFYNNKIYIVNFNSVLHIVEIKHDVLRFQKSVVLDTNFNYHGLHVFENKLYAVTTVSHNNSPYVITEYDLTTEKKRNIQIQGNNHRMKDIMFVNKDFAIICTNFNDREIGLGKQKEIYDAEILLCSFDGNVFKVLDSKTFEGCHIDSIMIYKDTFYSTATFDTCGSFVLKGSIQETKLCEIQKIKCPAFPHGLDIYEDKIALSCYGTHSTLIYPLSSLIE